MCDAVDLMDLMPIIEMRLNTVNKLSAAPPMGDQAVSVSLDRSLDGILSAYGRVGDDTTALGAFGQGEQW